jgi:hypothetical protein
MAVLRRLLVLWVPANSVVIPRGCVGGRSSIAEVMPLAVARCRGYDAPTYVSTAATAWQPCYLVAALVSHVDEGAATLACCSEPGSGACLKGVALGHASGFGTRAVAAATPVRVAGDAFVNDRRVLVIEYDAAPQFVLLEPLEAYGYEAYSVLHSDDRPVLTPSDRPGFGRDR